MYKLKNINQFLFEKRLVEAKDAGIKDNERTVVLLDGTSSAGKSYTLKQVKAKHSYDKTRTPDDYEIIAIDDFVGFEEMNDPNSDHNKRRWELEEEAGIPKEIRDWAKKVGEYACAVESIREMWQSATDRREKKLKELLAIKNPSEEELKEIEAQKNAIKENKEFIKGIPAGKDHPEWRKATKKGVEDPRIWYMAQQYKRSKSKGIVFDDVQTGINEFLPKGTVKNILLHAPINKLRDNLKTREESDPRDPSLVFNDYVTKYSATKNKPADAIGDTRPITKEEMIKVLKSTKKESGFKLSEVDDNYIDQFIKDMGMEEDGTYYIKIKDEYLKKNKPVLINSDDKGKFLEEFKTIVKEEDKRVKEGRKVVGEENLKKQGEKEIKTEEDTDTLKLFSGIEEREIEIIKKSEVNIVIAPGKKKTIQLDTLMDFIPVDKNDPEEKAMIKAQSKQYVRINTFRIKNGLDELIPFEEWLERKIELAKDNIEYQERLEELKKKK